MARKNWCSHRQVADLVRRCLKEGSSVEIDGLGIFRPDANGGYHFIPETRPQVFLAYAVEDLPLAEKLSDRLDRHGFEPWLDKRKLLPGQNWPRAIERAIEASEFFIACLSRHSLTRRGRFHAELRYAMDCASQQPIGEIYLIPVRLDDCQVPREISAAFQYVDLFTDWTKGLRTIARVMREQVRRRARQNRPRAA